MKVLLSSSYSVVNLMPSCSYYKFTTLFSTPHAPSFDQREGMGTGWQLVGVETRHLVETASRELEPSFEKFTWLWPSLTELLNV